MKVLPLFIHPCCSRRKKMIFFYSVEHKKWNFDTHHSDQRLNFKNHHKSSQYDLFFIFFWSCTIALFEDQTEIEVVIYWSCLFVYHRRQKGIEITRGWCDDRVFFVWITLLFKSLVFFLNVFERSLLCSPRLHLLDQNTVKTLLSKLK